MSEIDDAEDRLPPAPTVIERIHRLRHVIESPLRADIIAALLLLGRSTVKALAERLDEAPTTVARHVCFMRGEGILDGDFWLPDAVAESASVELAPSIARALGDFVRELGDPLALPLSSGGEPSGVGFTGAAQRDEEDRPVSGDDLFRLSYFLLRAQGRGTRHHRDALLALGSVLGSPVCIDILVELLIAEPATTAEVAERLRRHRPGDRGDLMAGDEEAVASEMTRLADNYVVRPVAGATDQWTITPTMKQAFGGFYDQLLVMRELATAAAGPRNTPREPDAESN